MQIDMIPIDELKPHPANTKEHGKANLASICVSLETYGQTLPLVILKKNKRVLVGNGRLQVMKELGWKEVACHQVSLPDDEAEALAIADNRTGEMGTWHKENLARALKKLPDKLQAVTGFTEKQRDRLKSTAAKAKSTFAGVVRRCPECGHEWQDGKAKLEKGGDDL